MKKQINLKGYTPISEGLPHRTGTYRVMTAGKVISTAYWSGLRWEYHNPEDTIEFWSDKRSKV